MEESNDLAAHVDSDGSGLIERDEFFVFMRPLMSISQSTEYIAQRVDGNGEKTALFAPFIYKIHYFTKTGSGQT